MATFVGVWKGKTIDEVHAWYLRLADLVARKNKAATVTNPLSPMFLRHYLKGSGKELKFAPPQHLKDSKYIKSALIEHRKTYLSQSQLKGKTVGLAPRIAKEGSGGLTKAKEYSMSLHKLKEMPVAQFLSAREKANIAFGGDAPDDMYQRVQKNYAAGDADLFSSLRAFQVASKVKVLVTPQGKSKYTIEFKEFLASVFDYYDFDKGKRLKLPNPDYNNQFKVKNPIAPNSELVMTHHTNLKQLVKASKAKPFDVKSNDWSVQDQSVTKAETVAYP